jgi:hypothetical protein
MHANEPTKLDLEVAGLLRRLWNSGWDWDTALADARAACGAAWDMDKGRHVYTGYIYAPREVI